MCPKSKLLEVSLNNQKMSKLYAAYCLEHLACIGKKNAGSIYLEVRISTSEKVLLGNKGKLTRL